MIMKTIISRGLALFLLGTILIASASPIALNHNTLVQHNSQGSGTSIGTNAPSDVDVDPKLSDTNRLTRRNPVDSPPLPELNVHTPLDFITSLRARQANARLAKIKLWKSRGVSDLEAKIAELKTFGSPQWWVDELHQQIFRESRSAKEIKEDEGKDSPYLETITKYQGEIKSLGDSLEEKLPRSVNKASSDRLSHSPSTTGQSAPGHPTSAQDNVIDRRVEDLHTKARRKRINAWEGHGKEHGVESLKEKVRMFSRQPWNWLLYSECANEITHMIFLVELFQTVETDEEYLTKLGNARTAVSSLSKALEPLERKEFYNVYIEILYPQIKKDGGWRKLFETLTPGNPGWSAQIDAGIKMCRWMSITRLPNPERPEEGLEGRESAKEFYSFLEKKKGDNESDAGRKGR